MRLTGKILVATAVGLALYDIYAAATKEKGDTISEVLAGWMRKRPIIAVGVGVGVGHICWPLPAPGSEGDQVETTS